MNVRFLSVGDRALTVEFGDAIDRALSREVLRLDRAIRAGAAGGCDRDRADLPLADVALRSDRDLAGRSRTRHHRADRPSARWPRSRRGCGVSRCAMPANIAPDLDEVAQRTGLTPAEIVALHSGARYHVYMLGFLPGFPYMGDLPAELALPRRADPRVRVPAGSIAIATTLERDLSL